MEKSFRLRIEFLISLKNSIIKNVDVPLTEISTQHNPDAIPRMSYRNQAAKTVLCSYISFLRNIGSYFFQRKHIKYLPVFQLHFKGSQMGINTAGK